MRAQHSDFPSIIDGATQFIVPVFQRDYSWSEVHCTQLFDDVLLMARDSTTQGHFIGSLVYIPAADSAPGFTRWLLIDGQQRLTTLTLLLIALRDYINSTGWSPTDDDGPTAKRIEGYFLRNLQESGAREYKLLLRGRDHVALTALVDRVDLPDDTTSRVLENYELLRERLEGVNPDTVYRGVCRLIFVDVTLERGIDDPQLIFESLNSTGLDLSQSDLIRNFVLMSLPERDQARLYRKYWSLIEALFQDSERIFDSFMRDYIALDTHANKQQRSDQIYASFRRHYSASTSDPEQLEGLLSRLARLARYYAAFSVGTESDDLLTPALRRLRGLADVPAMLVMRLFDCHDRLKTLSRVDFLSALELIESYLLRRAVCGLQTRGYWLTFARIAYSVTDHEPLESLSVRLALLPENYAFPSDTKFREALETSDIYHRRVCFYLLDRLENHNSKEVTDTSNYSIEHILPQNERLRPEWREMLGDRWREIQSEAVNRLGNLTLTGYNSTYSDRPFEEKRRIRGGFSDSSVRLNKPVREKAQWTEQEINDRGKDLAVRALDVWPALTVDQSLIDSARDAELRDQAAGRDALTVPMSAVAMKYFKLLRTHIMAIDSRVIELAESRSVSYHAPTFFLEMIPRKGAIGLLLALDFNEVEDQTGRAQDTSQWKFIVNAAYDAGVYVLVSEDADVDSALPLIRKAHELAKT